MYPRFHNVNVKILRTIPFLAMLQTIILKKWLNLWYCLNIITKFICKRFFEKTKKSKVLYSFIFSKKKTKKIYIKIKNKEKFMQRILFIIKNERRIEKFLFIKMYFYSSVIFFVHRVLSFTTVSLVKCLQYYRFYNSFLNVLLSIIYSAL